MNPKPTLLLQNAAEILTCVPDDGGCLGRRMGESLLLAGEEILATGALPELESRYDLRGIERADCRGKVLAPGFVDAHTHVVFGGSRVREYALKMTHTSEEVGAMGFPTGITASMTMTRAAGEEALFRDAAARLRGMLFHGTTTVESKSGYGLDLENELKMLRVNRRLSEAGGSLPDIVPTFLGAHAIPPGKRPEDYVDELVSAMIPAVAQMNLAVFCDVYIDEGYFNREQTARILRSAREAGLLLKIHADQYAAIGGAELAAEMGVVSVDHLNYTSPETAAALAAAGVVGVLMPLIDFAVRHPHPFDATMLRRSGMTLALATDICPGGWTESMQLVMQFACRVHGFSPEEALFAATVGGARALALEDRGALAPGMLADIQIWDLPTFEDVIYRLGHNAVTAVVKRGAWISSERDE